jgi:hypothetical protein
MQNAFLRSCWLYYVLLNTCPLYRYTIQNASRLLSEVTYTYEALHARLHNFKQKLCTLSFITPYVNVQPVRQKCVRITFRTADTAHKYKIQNLSHDWAVLTWINATVMQNLVYKKNKAQPEPIRRSGRVRYWHHSFACRKSVGTLCVFNVSL